jgi:hypothetical protein
MLLYGARRLRAHAAKNREAPTPGKCGVGAHVRSVTRREAWADPTPLWVQKVRCGKLKFVYSDSENAFGAVVFSRWLTSINLF